MADGVQDRLDDPQWWSMTLRAAPPAQVVSIDRSDDADAAGATCIIERFRLQWSGSTDAPRDVIVKRSAAGFGGMALAHPTPQWRIEADFYTRCAPALPLRTPHCWFAESSASGLAGLIVLEDLHTTWLDPIDADTVAEAVRALACAQAATWNGASLDLSWAPFGGLFVADEMPDLWRRLRPDVSPTRRAQYDEILPRLPALAATSRSMPTCLVHGDLSPRNLLRAHDGLAFIDFGTAARSVGGIDVSRLVASCADLAGSQAAHREVCLLWCDELTTLGLRGFDADDAWRSYRVGLALNAQFGALQEVPPWTEGKRAASYRLGAELLHEALGACAITDFVRELTS